MIDNFFSLKIYNNAIEDWLITLCFIAGSIVLGKFIKWFSVNVIGRLTKKTNTHLDDIIIDMLKEPMVCTIILVGFWLGINHLTMSKETSNFFNHIYKFLVVGNITWFVTRLVNSLINEYLMPITETGEKNLDNHAISLIRKILNFSIWSIGLITALNNAGIDVGALITGLGIGGVAIALAAQDTAKNIFGGFMILLDKPFRIGDLITVDGQTGFVEEMGMRSIRIRTYSGRLIIIPNYKTADSNLENITQEPSRRVELKLGLTYDTTPQKMEEAMNILASLPSSIPEIDEKTLTYFSGYGDSSLNITCYYFIKKESDLFETQSKVNLFVLHQFNKQQIEFAFPTQTLYVKK